MTLVRFAATILLLALAVSSPAAKPADAAPGATFDALAYDVRITPDLAAHSVAAAETVRLRIVGDHVKQLVFSPNALVIDSARVAQREVTTSSTDKGTVITLPTSLDGGAALTLELRYHGIPAQGVTFGDQSVYTSYFACDWMFCPEDAPGDKARFDLSLTLPVGMTSLAAGDLVETRAAGVGAVVHHWRSERPYSAYLFGFAAGRFDTIVRHHGDADLVYLNATGTGQPLAQLFDQTPAMIDFLSQKAGLPLPAGRYSLLLAPGDEAQEAATYSLIGLSQIEPVLGNPQADWVLIHELAHQWWGNLITCRTWRDLWLDEGMAVFMTAAWKEHRFGHAAYEAELAVARKRYQHVKDIGWDRPLAFGGSYPSLGVRRGVQYSKGALFLDHLRSLLGDRGFWAGIKLFTRAHAGGTVVSADFQRAMEQASGRDLSAVFAEWVYGENGGENGRD